MKIVLSDMGSRKFEAPQNFSDGRCVELLGEIYIPRHCALPGQRWWDWVYEEEDDENEEL